MPWTPDSIRRELETRGWSQRQLRDAIIALTPGRKLSLRAVTAWVNGESHPSGRNLAALDRVFATDTPTADPLAHVDDFALLAEVAKRMAVGRAPGQYLPLTTEGANQRLRWDTAGLPSAERTPDEPGHPDAGGKRA